MWISCTFGQLIPTIHIILLNICPFLLVFLECPFYICRKKFNLKTWQENIATTVYKNMMEFLRYNCREVIKETTGMWWWEKTTSKTVWRHVNKWGNCLFSITSGFIHLDNYDSKIASFKTLKSALAKIDIMVSGQRRFTIK